MGEPVLVSACLLGLMTRYDGTSRYNHQVLDWLTESGHLPVPVCPEQLAGLPTPREQTRFRCGDGHAVLSGSGEVATASGQSMNDYFLLGARQTLRIAELSGCRTALLKERSPSCGVRQIHCGAQVVAGQGVTTALLTRAGLTVFSEEQLPPR